MEPESEPERPGAHPRARVANAYLTATALLLVPQLFLVFPKLSVSLSRAAEGEPDGWLLYLLAHPVTGASGLLLLGLGQRAGLMLCVASLLLTGLTGIFQPGVPFFFRVTGAFALAWAAFLIFSRRSHRAFF